MNDSFELHRHSQALLRVHCRALACLVRVGAWDARAGAETNAAFHRTLSEHRGDLLVDLFPALQESMAGSDAVCIREMQTAVAAQLAALEAAWRAACDAVRAGRSTATTGRTQAALDALCCACEQLLAHENGEAWPMAERLLDERALQQLAQAMRTRRSTP